MVILTGNATYTFESVYLVLAYITLMMHPFVLSFVFLIECLEFGLILRRNEKKNIPHRNCDSNSDIFRM